MGWVSPVRLAMRQTSVVPAGMVSRSGESKLLSV